MEVFHKICRIHEERSRKNILKEQLQIELDELNHNGPVWSDRSNYRLKKRMWDDISENYRGTNEVMNKFLVHLEKHREKFSVFPIGPLYKGISAKNREFARLIEYILRDYMFIFLAFTVEDKLLLKKMIKVHYARHVTDSDLGLSWVQMPKVYLRRPWLEDSDLNHTSFTKLVNAQGGYSLFQLIEIKNDYEIMFSQCVSYYVPLTATFLFNTDSEATQIVFIDSRRLVEIFMKPILVYSLNGFRMTQAPYFKKEHVHIFKHSHYLICRDIARCRDLERRIDLLSCEIDAYSQQMELIRLKISIAEKITSVEKQLSQLETKEGIQYV